MGRTGTELVAWIASHRKFEPYDEALLCGDDIIAVNGIIRQFNAIIHEARHAKGKR